MNRKIEITYNWWKNGDPDYTIDCEDNHKLIDHLEGHAQDHIQSQLKKGITFGDLVCTYDGESFWGVWEYNYIN